MVCLILEHFGLNAINLPHRLKPLACLIKLSRDHGDLGIKRRILKRDKGLMRRDYRAWGGQHFRHKSFGLCTDLGLIGDNDDTFGDGRVGQRDQKQDDPYRCHDAADDRKGSPPAFPSLVDSKLTEAEMTDVLWTGRGRMPAFRGLLAGDLKALLTYVHSGSDKTELSAAAGDDRPPYRFTGYRKFLDPDGYPATAAPWGHLTAIDLKTGKFAWRIRPIATTPSCFMLWPPAKSVCPE